MGDVITGLLYGTITDAKSRLKSNWPAISDLSGSTTPGRFEAEAGKLIIYGQIPDEINGTFYRVGPDRYLHKAKAIPIDGDGSISAFRIHEGQIDFKMKYVKTEKLRLEIRAGKSLFGAFQNPWDRHPCIRAAVDASANTNVIYWAGRLLALEETANPYQIDPDTLDTTGYDPFYDQIKSKSFSAHPKVDPYTEELVTFGYAAKGTGSDDVVTWSVGKDGIKTQELWVKQPFPTLIHDCGITENFIILMPWPFGHDIERMKKGEHHWMFRPDRPAPFVVVPRRPASPPAGWKQGESRVYYWHNCVNIHSAGAWEENGKLYIEASRVQGNVFPFFPDPEGNVPLTAPKADFVRWEIDPTKPSESWLGDPETVIDIPSEFPRLDERFMTKKYNIIFMAVYLQPDNTSSDNVFQGLNALAMINKQTGKTQYFYPGDHATVQEPTFIPRSDDAPEGDGWIMSVVDRSDARGTELVFIDTKDFTKPIAIAELPFHVKSQIHGNWIDTKELGQRKPLTYFPEEVKLFGKGPLERL
ncbi:carotenoid oxygenase [Paraphoma chrysanthemicola]|uniref:Carotenoid oxygenase n=1 Tax=Paraphoma chrysanthemicola TaxID=798071 RepID=A0A8K0VW78_9PLEO|nr:carotenoid oxygenase [Paraphoma chrysanthemicola]